MFACLCKLLPVFCFGNLGLTALAVQMMDSQRQLFVYYDHLTPRWTAVNAIISRICLMAGSKQKGQATSQAAGSMLSGSRATLVKQSSHDLRMAELSKLLGDKVQ